MSFMGRAAIVTGGSRGIGRAICMELARRGCDIAFNYARSAESAGNVVSEITALGRRARAYAADITDRESVERMIAQVWEEFGRIDYLVNNAGITRDKLLLSMTEREWDEVIEVNLRGAYLFSRAVIRKMVKARFGSILSISSVSGVVGMAGQTNYAASKAGLIGFTKALAKEVASRNITVNALALGLVQTDMTQSLPEEYRARMMESIPLRRYGTAEESARIAAFLLSDDARYITGQVIQADGGLAM